MSTKRTLIGSFAYQDDDLDQIDSVKRTFEIRILIDDEGIFEGISFDGESKGLFEIDIRVKGFIENNIISFTRYFPFMYFLNDNGGLEIDYSKPHHEVMFTGQFDSSSGSWKGDWEIHHGLVQVGMYEAYDKFSIGEWELKESDE